MHPGIQSWKNLLVYAFHAFSIPVLIRTLFSPWKMDRSAGSDYSFFEKAVFFIISRVLGLVARSILIIFGTLFSFFVLLLFPFFFFLPINIDRARIESFPSFGASLSYGNTFILNSHSRDLASSSSQKIYGKEKALRMVERGLSKGSMRNVLLVGDTGVGKSALVKHLGKLGQSGLSATGLRNHRVVELFMDGLDIQDFENCLNEASSAGNVVLVIENIHLYESIYDRLMPYLHASHLGIVATTDFSGYDQVLKNHDEFLSKFSKVDLFPPNGEETMSILLEKADELEISISREALAEIVRLTDRYIGSQSQPIKSISILEELGALGRGVSIEDVKQIVSDKTNIPIGEIGEDEKKVLLGLEATMKKKIIGQDEAVTDVASALRRLRAGISDPSKPAGSFLFLGPTGVGKTYTAKILAESYFGRKNAMIRFDMSEFSMPSSVGVFTERLAVSIEEAPLSLVFLDELEKADSAIHNLLLQVLDEGHITRSSGRTASFKESLVIATSNAGSADIIANPNMDKKTLINRLIGSRIFAPEFLNRWNDVILFKPLDAGQAKKIASLMLFDFRDRLFEDKKIMLIVDDALIEKVASAGFDPDFGARPIKRAMEEIVENKVAEYILSGEKGKEIRIL